MHEKRKLFKNLVLCGLGLTMPATFIISASCQHMDDSTEKYLYWNKKVELINNLSLVKTETKKNEFNEEFLLLESLEETNDFKKNIEFVETLDNKVKAQIALEKNESPTPQPEDPNTGPEPDPNNGKAVTTNHGYKIEYDSSDDFYSSLDGLSGDRLREQLFTIQKNNRGKTGSYDDLHRTYRDAFVDKYYENDGTVLDLYTEIIGGKDKYTFEFGKYRYQGNSEGQGMNREHIIAQSWFRKQAPMRNDAHHVWPSDKKVNAIHGNFPYGETKNGRIVSSNGSKLGAGVEDNQQVFEVIDEFKGDIARVFFYFVLTYGDKNINNNHSSNRVFIRQNGKYTINSSYLKTYLKWNKMDGISQFDIDRNNGIYKHQHNRNPFTDYPELIKVIFENDNNYVFQNKGIAKKLVKIN
ncbi:endonuclease [Mycoplasmopsis arginini]|uniref:endonuclease n=1 Tax=Mycoplasmopsis arginini TaxID=2094 RepID=UPI00249EB98E|nr:endonuclease [Mycoplasmopsis arginini]MDI3351666.1 endonuclease [Mycoplasmopsis arginini]MDI3352205.1 endonuclease [Mycoplasmopsis arginini]